ncbi:MAG: methylmalonyl-CoA mutase small subunit [Planctomycetales bacterium]|nr:methylmalonyl-CoA mutase small subunit [Planctomycetales bacterium]
MLPANFTIKDDFPAVAYDEWRTLVDADLKGGSFERRLVAHTYEGIEIQPLYARSDVPDTEDPHGLPGFAPFRRGASFLGASASGWELCAEHAAPKLAETNSAILEDVQGGACSLLLRLDRAACQGLDPDDAAAAQLAGTDGLMAYHLDDFDAALQHVDVGKVAVALEAGAAFLPAAAILSALWRRREVDAKQARGAFGADPFAALASAGQLPYAIDSGLEQVADLAAWTHEHLPQVTPVAVNTSVYHDAGATATQDIAFALATGVAYLRAMTSAGLEVGAAARSIRFSFRLGTHHFRAIAKLRAARRLWSRVVEVCGGEEASQAMRIHAGVGRRVLTCRDPYVNLLRNTATVFAAGVGGAESISSAAFDSTYRLPDRFSRRIARNTLLVLQEEAHLNRVVDPAGGSWFLESLTDQMATKAWALFQEIEQRGGMAAVLESGWIAEQIEQAFAPRAADIARRKQPITGVSEFPDLDEPSLDRERPDYEALRQSAVARIVKSRPANSRSLDESNGRRVTATVAAATGGASLGQLARALGFTDNAITISPIPPRPFAESFEALRDASDAWLAETGQRPHIFLANMGPIAQHTARATWSKNFFSAGGFAAPSNDGFANASDAVAAFAASGAKIAVICSSDRLYPEIVPELARRLKEAGARSVILAGKPAENESAWRDSGVNRFIYLGCDVLGTLTDLLREEGVLA